MCKAHEPTLQAFFATFAAQTLLQKLYLVFPVNPIVSKAKKTPFT
jgi:hypothetical protein